MQQIKSYSFNLIVLILVFFTISTSLFRIHSKAEAPDNWRWVERNKGLSGQIQEVLINPTTPSTMYSSTMSRGIFKTTNSGTSWAEVNNGLPTNDLGVYDLEMDLQNPDTLYVSISKRPPVIYKTTNGGLNWNISNTGIKIWSNPLNGIRYIKIDPTNSNIIYAGSAVGGDEGGVWQSLNAGVSWTWIASSATDGCNNDVGPIVIDSLNNQKIYAGSYHYGVQVSTDGGYHWTRIGTSSTNVVNQILIDNANHNKIFVARNEGFYISLDGASNWTKSSTLLGTVYSIAQDPGNANIMYASTMNNNIYGIYKSTDNGATWSSLGYSDYGATRITIHPTTYTTLFFASDSKGLNKSINSGTSATALNTGLPIIPVIVHYIKNNGHDMFAGTTTGIYKTTDSGLSWINKKPISNATNALAINPSNPNEMLAAFNNVLYKSSDAGETWNLIFTSPLTYIMSLAFDQTDPNIIFMVASSSSNYVLKSIDGGVTWNSKLSATGFARDVAVDPSDHDYVYATFDGGFYKSINNGESWTMTDNNAGHNITIDSIDRTIYKSKTVSGLPNITRILTSIDLGDTWQEINPGVTDGYPALKNIVIDSNNHNTLYVNEQWSGYVFKSINKGLTWNKMTTTGIPSTGYAYYITQDPLHSERILASYMNGSGIYAYENYKPILTTSNFSITDDNGGTIQADDTLTYSIELSNTGWGDSINTHILLTIPSGLEFVPGSFIYDYSSISPDPFSGSSLDLNIGTLKKDQPFTLTFQVKIRSDVADNIVFTQQVLVTSDTDLTGTSTNSVQYTIETKSVLTKTGNSILLWVIFAVLFSLNLFLISKFTLPETYSAK